MKLTLKPEDKAARLSFETPPQRLPSRRIAHSAPEPSQQLAEQEAFEANYRDDLETEATDAGASTRKILVGDGAPARKRARQTLISTAALPPTPTPATRPRAAPASAVIDLVDSDDEEDDDDDVICVEPMLTSTPARSAAPVPAVTVLDMSASGGDDGGTGMDVAEGGDNVSAAADGGGADDGGADDDGGGAAATAAVNDSSSSNGSAGSGGSGSGSGSECIVCMETGRPKAAVVPCGHTQTCHECLQMLQQTGGQQWCPVCRGKIAAIVRLYGLS